ncbi:MAG: ABC transporter ATP-binding protein [Chloroflexi bacterium]|nr:ABC transporter ATP-binding protein [Chloroflexota bacterium]
MSLVELQGIKKFFDDVRAVDGIELEIENGEFLVILGPSGCGKTTLMRMIAGLEKPTAGQIFIGGENVTALPPRKRGVSMVFQSYALYPHMNVFNNIAFPLKAQSREKKYDKRAIRDKVENTARLLEIDMLLDRRPRQLSGGQRQRVAIARAMVTQPAVLLLDEPLSNLDAKLRANARDELKEFQRSSNITAVFVTHDQIEAMGLGDRIVVMSHGKIQQIGTPQLIYDDPANEFVATFLGSPSMNILRSDAFSFGFRPETFLPKTLADNPENSRIFHYYVKRVEYLGSDRLLYGYVHGHDNELTLAKVPSNVRVSLDVDCDYEFAVHNSDIKFFDKRSGQRIEQQNLQGVV